MARAGTTTTKKRSQGQPVDEEVVLAKTGRSKGKLAGTKIGEGAVTGHWLNLG